MGAAKRSAAPCAPRRQAPRFSERIIADGDALLSRLAYLHVNHSNKDVRRAAGATLDAAQHQARPEPRARPPGAQARAASAGCVVQEWRPGRAAGACEKRVKCAHSLRLLAAVISSAGRAGTKASQV